MTTIALSPRAAPSLYSGMILALIGLALALQVSFVAGLAQGRGGFSARPPSVTESVASLPTPCATP
jgi:hypothetical protein